MSISGDCMDEFVPDRIILEPDPGEEKKGPLAAIAQRIRDFFFGFSGGPHMKMGTHKEIEGRKKGKGMN